jgi:molybdopterin-guanine dinucleotide biosynthesis protein A
MICKVPRTKYTNITGVILAGGKSRRMRGGNKALIEIDGVKIVQRAANVLLDVFEEVICITNTPEDFAFLQLPLFGDLIPNGGALGGLYSGLHFSRNDRIFVAACDMPFLNSSIIAYMCSKAEMADIVVPHIGANFEPLHALYSKRCLPHMRHLLEHGDLAIINVFDKVKVLEISETEMTACDPSMSSIRNINTPDDLFVARSLVTLEGGG